MFSDITLIVRPYFRSPLKNSKYFTASFQIFFLNWFYDASHQKFLNLIVSFRLQISKWRVYPKLSNMFLRSIVQLTPTLWILQRIQTIILIFMPFEKRKTFFLIRIFSHFLEKWVIKFRDNHRFITFRIRLSSFQKFI